MDRDWFFSVMSGRDEHIVIWPFLGVSMSIIRKIYVVSQGMFELCLSPLKAVDLVPDHLNPEL